MKRIYASLGMAALGVASIQSVQGQSADASKPWNVSASLRGFYDDNVRTTPKSGDKIESFGFEVRPSVGINLPLEQTTISANYEYGYKWYDKAIGDDPLNPDHDSSTHTFGARLSHTFNERMAVSLQDSFVIGQEPDFLRLPNGAVSTYQYISGDNIRNFGAINFNAQVTRQFGVEVGYANAWFDYDSDQFSALLDRLEHTVHLDGRFNLQRDTVAIIGYQFGWVDYTADMLINPLDPLPLHVMSDSRNNRSHYGYVGLEHQFLPDLFGSIRAGARFNDYYNSPEQKSDISPYVQASLNYQYAPESSIQIGVSHDRHATDQFFASVNSITRDMDTTVAYLSLIHRIVPNLFGSLLGTFQYDVFNGGLADGQDEQFYMLGVNLEYRFNRHVSAEVGYNYDLLDAGSPGRDFDRNRAYIGATFVY